MKKSFITSGPDYLYPEENTKVPFTVVLLKYL